MLLRGEVVTTRCNCARRRVFKGAGAALPALLIALLPKCPICLAAWIAAGSGIGISAGAAGGLRVFVMILCLTPLIYLLIRARGAARSA